MEDRSAHWDPAFRQSLLRSNTPSEFLAAFVGPSSAQAEKVRQPRRVGYAELTRRAGFSSRAFIRDVVCGSKKMSLESAERVCAALGITGYWKRYFLLLTETSDSARLQPIRERLSKPKYRKLSYQPKDQQRISKLLSVNVPTVFAACGSVEKGASLKEIHARTKLRPTVVSQALDQLISLSLLEVRDGHFYPQDLHLAYEKLGGDAFFRRDMSAALVQASRRFQENSSDPSTLYFSSTLCVQSARLPELSHRLRLLLEEFAHHAEESKGDRIAEIALGFTHN